MEWIKNSTIKGSKGDFVTGANTVSLSIEKMEGVLSFHKSIPGYQVTPLLELNGLAKHLGVERIWVKDESKRFNLNAFKVLGGTYAVARYMAERAGIPENEMTFNKLLSPEVRSTMGDVTFYTATDGNHGHGLAWAAKQLGQSSVVFMPKGSAIKRLERIQAEGATAEITELNYDDAVKLADCRAKEEGGILVQDTAFKGYETVPMWIMQGYGTIMHEVVETLETHKWDLPTHVFLQAGVGSFAGAMQGYLVEKYGEKAPTVVIVEPQAADCIYQSVKAGDGEPHAVRGDLSTIMAGLACGEPSTISWEILRDYSAFCVSCEDEVSEEGMRLLAYPQSGDPVIVSGESGAVGAGLLQRLVKDEAYHALSMAMGLNAKSRVLIISTEGDTDPKGYQRIVGAAESCQ